ncbi:MAG: PVC-type heme-binding CxxCH protein [Halioglobus sp.]
MMWLQRFLWVFCFLAAPCVASGSLPHIVIVAGTQSHGYGEHEFNAGGEILARDLNASGLVRATLYRDGWPNTGIDKDADAIVLYMDGDGGHAVNDHLAEVDELVSQGVGFVALHYAVHATEPIGEAYFKRWLGGYYHSQISTNPHWRAEYGGQSNHPIFNGVEKFSAHDEFYFNLLFTPQAVPIFTATPPDLAREHVPHPRRTFMLFGGSPPDEVINNRGREETIAWGVERPDGGRGFGFTGGHFHWNWGNVNYRRFVLNALLWSARVEVPEGGIAVAPISLDNLMVGQDGEPGRKFNKADIAREFGFADVSVLPPAAFSLASDLRVELWAASPLLFNPTNIDLDAQGRVWATEGWNYREMAGHRDEGDRVVVVYDTDNDGRADKSHTFVQDPQLKAPLGIAVVGNKVYVSQPPHLIEYTDVDSDLRYDPGVDKKRNLLSGFKGFDHDHSLHSVTVGPDGWMYANTGNTGAELTTQDQETFYFGSRYRNPEFQPRTSADGRVYVSGGAFRFRPDGTDLQVIGHNFRNSYEQVVSSFGDVYNNDNDDRTGSRTTRILEGGNLGYTADDGLDTWATLLRPGHEQPKAHWRQYDPDVQPAGDIYGDGAPTGIVMIEGDELGHHYRGTLLSAEAALNKIMAYRLGDRLPSGELPPSETWLSSNPLAQYSGIDLRYEIGQLEGLGNALAAMLRDAIAAAGLTHWFGWLYDDVADETLFRPSDIAIGPDGAVYISDWFDPRVGGHTAYDDARQGAIYRVSKAGSAEAGASAALDFGSTEGLVQALTNPAVNVRGHAFMLLAERGETALPALKPLLDHGNPFYRARAVWLLPHMGEEGIALLQAGLLSDDAQSRLLTLRVLHRHALLTPKQSIALSSDSAAAVRQELALILRDASWADSAAQLINIAMRYPVGDRHYLYALGVGASDKAQTLYLSLRKDWPAPHQWSQAQKDIAWRLHVPAVANDAVALAKNASGEAWRRAVDTIAFSGHEESAKLLAGISSSRLSVEQSEYLGWWLDRLRLEAEAPNEDETEARSYPVLDSVNVLALQSDAESGELLYGGLPCANCHSLGGQGGSIGPAMEAIVGSNDRASLVNNMVNPISPLMPPAAQLGLSEQQVADLVAYLLRLK